MPNWIPRKIERVILQAVQATDRSSYVFYVTGEHPGQGGNGKTIMLRRIGQALCSPDGMQAAMPWTGILDLNRPEVNTNSGLETSLSRALTTERNEFQPFEDERIIYDGRRKAGLVGKELEDERVHMAEVFVQCMNNVTTRHRVVIGIDTTEKIQYQLDEIQSLCDLENESTTVKAWLIDQLKQWQNSVVILVGRVEETPYLGTALTEAFAGTSVHYMPITLAGFDEDEVLAYFEAKKSEFPVVDELDRTTRLRLREITEGHPLRLDLLLEVLQHQVGTDRFLSQIQEQDPDAAHDEIDRQLIEQVMHEERNPSVREILGFMAIARNGLDAKLLHHLAGDWDEAECQRRLDAMADRSFVKRRPDDKRLFLHDEMYRLCDRHLYAPRLDEVRRLSESIVAFYDAQLEQLEDVSNLPTKAKRRNLLVDSLLYRLHTNPREGYEWYSDQAAEAIQGTEVGLDMGLRNELLGFVKSPSPVDQRLLRDATGLLDEINADCGARWVKRLTMRGSYDQATRVGDIVAERVDLTQYPLTRAELDSYRGEALIYKGEWKNGEPLLTTTIETVEGGQNPATLARQNPLSWSGRRRNRVLGRSHNDLGYGNRILLKRYQMALREFQLAMPYFRASDLREEIANTGDNMARVYAHLYQRGYAEALVEDGLELRRVLGRDYRVALSLRSYADICLAFKEPHLARTLSREMLKICENLGARRGIGLGCITMGQALRALGSESAAGIDDPDSAEYLSTAIGFLERAEKIFEQEAPEPAHLVEVYDELGCVYREQAALARSRGQDTLARVTAGEAQKYLSAAVQEAEKLGMPVIYADVCEDLAQVCFQRGDFDPALKWLDRAEAKIDPRYKIAHGRGWDDVCVEECVEESWQMLGKTELLRGHIAYDAEMKNVGKLSSQVLYDIMQHYAFAVAYFECYSEQSPRLETTSRQLHTRFKTCKAEDLKRILTLIVPSLADKFDLDLTRLKKFFTDTLGPIADE